ncbi:MAG: hypothetical protein AAFQ82_07015, partial [Myxococcota bacterium]
MEKTVVAESSNRYRRPGDELRYEITVTNVGNAPATDVNIRDVLDLSLLDDIRPSGNTIRLNNELRFPGSANPGLSPLNPGESFVASYRARIADDAPNGSVIVNQALVSASEFADEIPSDDPSTPEPDDATRLMVEFPELVLTKSLDATLPVQPGDPVGYTLELSNQGTVDAQNVRLEDAVPAELIDLEAIPNAQIGVGRLIWTSANIPELAALEPGGSVSVTLTSTLDLGVGDGTVVANQASVTADDVSEVGSDDPSTPEPADATVFTVTEVPTLAAAKILDDSDAVVNPGQSFSYAIEVLNQGGNAARDVVVRDPVPSALEVLEAQGATIDEESNEVVWNLDELTPGETVPLRLDVRVRPGASNGTQISNQASLSAAGLNREVLTDDPTLPGDEDPTVATVSASPLLNGTVLFAEDLNGGSVQPGDTIRYTLRVLNVGTSESTETRATLPLPPLMQYVAQSTTLNGAAVPDLTDGPLAGSSPIFDSMMTGSRRPGTQPGVVLPTLGETPSDEIGEVVFLARVDPRALQGTVLETQASIVSSGTVPVASDDCSRSLGVACDEDPLIGEPTVLVVGGGPSLSATKVWELVGDVDSNGRPDPGDTIRYTILTTNRGSEAAQSLNVVDELPSSVNFVPGSITLDGTPLSDSETVSGARVEVAIDALAPGSVARVSLEVLVGEVDVVVNQASVSAAGRTVLSDGDPSIAGNQPTRTVIDPNATLVSLYLEASDRNGGLVEAGDLVRYALTVVNDGGTSIDGTELLLERESVFEDASLTAPEDAVLNDERPSWSTSLPAGERRTFVVEAAIRDDTEEGRVLSALARLPALGIESAAADLVVGGGAGTSTFAGQVFLERGERNGVFDPGTDEALSGFSVVLVPEGAQEGSSTRANPDLGALAIRTVLTGSDGRYSASAIPPGRYEVLATTPSGAVFGQAGGVLEARAGLTEVPAIAIDPSGIIYQIEDDVVRPVSGARVFLVDETSGEDLDSTLVAAGQQGQVTTGQGFYRFDLRPEALPGEFRLRVEPPNSNLFFPSGLRPPVGASAEEPLGSPAPPGQVSRFDFPNPAEDGVYYLRFELDADSEDVTNNHVPLDRLDQAIRLTKQVNRRRASVGDIVTYTITIQNTLTTELDQDEVGARLVDILPAGLQWANDTQAVRTVAAQGQETASGTLAVARRTSRSVEFEPMSLPGLSTTTIRYYGVIGLQAEGELTNEAELRNSSNVAISNRGS